MKKKFYILLFPFAMLCSCQSWLDVEPKDRVTGDAMLSSDGGIEAYMAGQYDNLPMEDFRYDFTINGFNQTNIDGGKTTLMALPQCVHSEGWNDHAGETNRFGEWETLYDYIRGFNEIKENLPLMTPSNPATLDQVRGEYHFMMAYAYMALARRYGGVPIIDEYQEFSSDYESLKVPRNTEVDTWKFILEMCDSAAYYLPDNTDQRRANKWTAYALKSRAALHAASVGKFWSKDGAALTGPAVDQELVGGFTDEDIRFFYQECIDASAEVIRSGKFWLNGANPATPEEAAENYRQLFVNGVGIPEVIFLRDYVYPGKAHNMGKWHEPNQLSNEFAGRMNPTLDYVESFAYMDPETHAAQYDVEFDTVAESEDYAVEQNSGTYSWLSHVTYENVTDIFANRDPRLYASVILPGTEWGGETIIMQSGIVTADMRFLTFGDNVSYEFGGQTYWSKGAAAEADYSGWGTTRANGSRTGFLLKKYLPGPSLDQIWGQVTTPFVDIRYAEVLLNYAEAVAESGLPNAEGVITAEEALNQVHSRAGFTDHLACTPEVVWRERKAEMGLEYGLIWDYWRKRELHTIFDGVYRRKALVPMLDFLHDPSKPYIFTRAYAETTAKIFEPMAYYRPIPGIAGNSLVQNPNY